jgi:hypothetical protein
VLRVWGVPTDSQLVAFLVADEHQPYLVAEFATLRVIRRQGRRLVASQAGARLRLREKSNALWIVYGPIVQAADSSLVIESLTIAPAFEGQLSRTGDDTAHGITAELLRLLSPAQLLSAIVERLQREGYWLDVAARHGDPAMSQRQRDLLNRIEHARPRQEPIDEQLVAIAQRYITLCQLGFHHPLPQLALEFGITRTQARDRIHKARQHQYLAPGQQGRATPAIGPRLKELGWSPPLPPTEQKRDK